MIHTTINEYKSQFRVQSKTSSVPPASLSGPSPFLSPADPLTLARQSLTSHGPPVQSLGQQQSAFNTFGAAAAQQPAAAKNVQSVVAAHGHGRCVCSTRLPCASLHPSCPTRSAVCRR